MTTTPWYQDHRNLADFIEALTDDEGFAGSEVMETVIEIIREPWKWTAEYKEMEKRNG